MAADRDAQAFAGLMRSANPPHDALMEATEAPLQVAERAHNLYEDLQRVAADCPRQYISDVTTAIGLALSAKSGAIATVELNLSRLDGAKDESIFEARIGKLK